MSKAKSPAPAAAAARPRVAEFVKRMLVGEPRGVVWSLLLMLLFAGGVFALWRQVRSQVAEKEEYQIGPRQIEITPKPQWIRTDPVADVLGGVSLDAPLNLLDEQLSQRLFDAFSAHPWVARVERVGKRYPARVQVDLVYRRPVCMVEIVGSPRSVEGQVLPGELQPIDVQGVLLPAADFPPVERTRYPRLGDIAATPIGPAGTFWGDPRVKGGAEVAQALGEVWREFNLAYIIPSIKPEAGPSQDEYSFDLLTAGGTRIRWGRSPASDMPGEVPAVDKISRLKELASKNGSLDSPEDPQIIDVRGWHRLTSRPMRPDEIRR